MAGSLSNTFETHVLNYLFTATTPASLVPVRPTVWHVALFTDAAGISADPGPVTEATTGTCPGYARQPVSFSAASGGTIVNGGAQGVVTFTATGPWAAVNYFAIYDASTVGTMIAWGNIPTKTLANTDQLKFDNAQITITLD